MIDSATQERGPTSQLEKLHPHLSLTSHKILVGCEFLQSHWTTCVQTVSTDSNLCSEPKFTSIIEAGRCIPEHSRRVNLTQKSLCSFSFVGHNRITVVRSIGLDMLDRFMEPRYDTD